MRTVFDTNVWKIRYHQKAYFLTLSIIIAFISPKCFPLISFSVLQMTRDLKTGNKKRKQLQAIITLLKLKSNCSFSPL